MVNADLAISNAMDQARSHSKQNVLFFAAASNFGGSKKELFPAKHPLVFSIRATDTVGVNQPFNPSLPPRGELGFGTLGLQVPTANKGKTMPRYSPRDGTSVATAVMAAMAAVVVGYVNINDKSESWNNIKRFEGFRTMLDKLSTEPSAKMRFVSLESYLRERDRPNLEAALTEASAL